MMSPQDLTARGEKYIAMNFFSRCGLSWNTAKEMGAAVCESRIITGARTFSISASLFGTVIFCHDIAFTFRQEKEI